MVRSSTARAAATSMAMAAIAVCLPASAGAARAQIVAGARAGQPCGCPVVAAGPTPAAAGLAADARLAAVLAARVCAEATALPSGASTDDLEAAIVYAVSQTDVKPIVIVAALNRLFGCDYGQHNFRAALLRVRDVYSSQRPGRGTAALSGGTGFRSAFTSPAIGTGGGSSNYTR